MSYLHRTGYVNPRLGTYFGIFIAAFAAIGLLALIFEGLGVPTDTLRLAMLFGPLVLYMAIGAAAFTRRAARLLRLRTARPGLLYRPRAGADRHGRDGTHGRDRRLFSHRLRCAVPGDRGPRRLCRHGRAARAVLP